MKVRVRLFALARQQFGADEIELQVPENATVAELRAALGERFPDCLQLMRRCLVAVNAEYARDDAAIGPQSEIALIPPVSGG